MTGITQMLTDPLMQRALLVALLVGLAAPVIGTYLVQRKLSLLGDGIGHVALTGVALGWLVGAALDVVPNDALAVPGAVVAAVAGAVVIEVVRERTRGGGDVALALLFYGGIAGGVLLIGIAGGTSANLVGYLFGSISTVSTSDVVLTVALCALLLGVGLGVGTISSSANFSAFDFPLATVPLIGTAVTRSVYTSPARMFAVPNVVLLPGKSCEASRFHMPSNTSTK